MANEIPETDLGEHIRGDDLDLTITISDSAGNAIDFQGDQLWFTLKDSLDKTDAQADAQHDETLATGTPITSYVFSVPAATMDVTIPSGKAKKSFFFDVQHKAIVSNSSKITTLAHGTLVIKADVTRDTS